MKTLKFVVIVFIFFYACLNFYCASTVNLEKSPRRGFTLEMDEPSARGVLSRVSQDQTNVMGRFCFSPDHNYLIYSGTQADTRENAQIWKMSITGGSPIKITSGGSNDCWSPSFTSNGEYLVYCSGGSIWKVKNDGSGGKLKIPGSGSNDIDLDISFSNKITFCSLYSSKGGINEKSLIWTCNIDGSELTQLREGKFPIWSPDGLKIVFVYNGEIWIINSDGTNLMQLTNTGNIEEGIPSFSPDGKKIVYVSNEGKDGKPSISDTNIWLMNIDGSNKTQITELSSWDSWPIWSKDNSIYFLSARAQKDDGSKIQRIWKLDMSRF